jgi:endo-1,4-beta-D-glucanase Y
MILAGFVSIVSYLMLRPMETDFLAKSWSVYKEVYLDPRGFVLDRTRERGQVTSEGQSYALLRAVWMRDAAAFERIFDWTERHMLRPDGLYSWLWSPAGEGRVVDANTATDGDQDIAMALLLAAEAFGRERYRTRGTALVATLRRQILLRAGTAVFPSAGNWANAGRIINLSYFRPWAYPYFHRVDPEGGWLQVITTGYDLIHQVRSHPGTLLVPDFSVLTSEGRIASVTRASGFSGEFSFDAMRLFWHVAFDCRLHRRAAACSDPLGASAFAAVIERDGFIGTKYTLSGEMSVSDQSYSFDGGLLPAFEIHAPRLAAKLKAGRLAIGGLVSRLHRPDLYYDQNWTWFGVALSSGFLVERMPAVQTITSAR